MTFYDFDECILKEIGDLLRFVIGKSVKIALALKIVLKRHLPTFPQNLEDFCTNEFEGKLKRVIIMVSSTM